jgi:hypothetical protein
VIRTNLGVDPNAEAVVDDVKPAPENDGEDEEENKEESAEAAEKADDAEEVVAASDSGEEDHDEL